MGFILVFNLGHMNKKKSSDLILVYENHSLCDRTPPPLFVKAIIGLNHGQEFIPIGKNLHLKSKVDRLEKG